MGGTRKRLSKEEMQQRKQEMLEARQDDMVLPDMVDRELRHAQEGVDMVRKRSDGLAGTRKDHEDRVKGKVGGILDEARRKEQAQLEKSGEKSTAFKDHAERQKLLEPLEKQLATIEEMDHNSEAYKLQMSRVGNNLKKRIEALKLKDVPGVDKAKEVAKKEMKKVDRIAPKETPSKEARNPINDSDDPDKIHEKTKRRSLGNRGMDLG